MVSFFNDVDVSGNEPWIAAVQYFGTKGFFHDYNARMNEPLKHATGVAWVEGLRKLREGRLDPMAQAAVITQTELADSKNMTAGEFAELLSAPSVAAKADAVITRGEAMTSLFQSLLPISYEH